MYYVAKKVKDRYQIKDTESSEVLIKSYNELMIMYRSGVEIKGVSIVEGVLTVTPSSNIWGLNDKLLAKNKLLTGTYTGIKGFDIDFKDDGKVFALPVDREFAEYVVENAVDHKFVFALPDIITDLSDNFLSKLDALIQHPIDIVIDLPKSLVNIGRNGLITYSDNFIVRDIKFNNIVKGIRTFGGSSVSVTRGYGNDKFTIPVNNLDCFTLRLRGINELYLPDIIKTAKYSINICESNRIKVYLGKGLRSITNFFFHRKINDNLSSLELMTSTAITYLDEDSDIGYIGFHMDEKISDYFCSYIFVLSESLYEKICERLKSKRGIIRHSNIFIGILTYRNREELDDIDTNIFKYCDNYSKYFSRYLTKEDGGKFTRLRLKEFK